MNRKILFAIGIIILMLLWPSQAQKRFQPLVTAVVAMDIVTGECYLIVKYDEINDTSKVDCDTVKVPELDRQRTYCPKENEGTPRYKYKVATATTTSESSQMR